mgnify:CR=1 FL=1
MKDVELLGIAKSADNNQIHHVATDPKASFTIVRPNLPEDYSPACVEWVDPRKVDYNLLPPTHLQEKYSSSVVKNEGLPLSYLQISTVEEGASWYKSHTRYPDEVCDMLAKYEWGDLRYTTKKEFRNQKKKRERKKPPSGSALKIKKGPLIVKFE